MSADAETKAEKRGGEAVSGSSGEKPTSESTAARTGDSTLSRRLRAGMSLRNVAKHRVSGVRPWSHSVRKFLKTALHFPRTRPWLTGTLVLSVILAAFVGNFSLGTNDEQRNAASRNSFDFDDIEVYAPDLPPAAVKKQGQPALTAAILPQSRSGHTDGGVERLKISPMKKSAYADGPQISPVFPRVPDHSQGPRRVWLTGTIEDVSPEPSSIRRISHVELPASRKNRDPR